MTITSHLVELRRKHDTLSEMVEEAQRSPGIDDLKVADEARADVGLRLVDLDAAAAASQSDGRGEAGWAGTGDAYRIGE